MLELLTKSELQKRPRLAGLQPRRLRTGRIACLDIHAYTCYSEEACRKSRGCVTCCVGGWIENGVGCDEEAEFDDVEARSGDGFV